MSERLSRIHEMARQQLQARRLIEGPEDKLMSISPKKYDEPMIIMDKALRDDWKHWHVTMVHDLAHFRTLQPKEQRIIQRNLGFLSNLDGIQLNTLSNSIGAHVTATEYRMALVRQTYEELVHVLTYDRIINTLEMDQIETYNLFMTDEVLEAKNNHILKMAELLKGDSYSPENFVRAVAANQALEGIYFQFGFKLFYIFDKRGKMPGVAQNIRYINRDESSHLRIFNSMWRVLQQERPELFTKEVLDDCRQILREAAEMEVFYAKNLIEGGILGVTDSIAEGSIKFGANELAEAIGLGTLFPEVTKDPLAWTRDYLKSHGVETNFFENVNIDYEDRGLEW
jgi:ribonucleoside-diphosphate reductase beta chain